MRIELLKSQFQTMEEPGQALVVDVSQPPAAIVHQIRQTFSL
jgi:gluconate kinase